MDCLIGVMEELESHIVDHPEFVVGLKDVLVNFTKSLETGEMTDMNYIMDKRLGTLTIN